MEKDTVMIRECYNGDRVITGDRDELRIYRNAPRAL